jgi:uncharacterized protein YraI
MDGEKSDDNSSSDYEQILIPTLVLLSIILLQIACGRGSPNRSEANESPTEIAAPASYTAAVHPTVSNGGVNSEEGDVVLRATVTTARLNVRSGPGTDYAIDGVVLQNDELTVTGQALNCEWLHVTTPAGIAGWVSGEFVRYDWACTRVAAMEIPPIPTATQQIVRADTPVPANPTPTHTPTLISADPPTATSMPTATSTPSPTLVSGNAPTPTSTPVKLELPTPPIKEPYITPVPPILVR